MGQIQLKNIDPMQILALDHFVTEDNIVQPRPYKELLEFGHDLLRQWMFFKGVYQMITTEQVEWCKDFIGDSKAIEVACGLGTLGRSLGIPFTDRKTQEEMHTQLQMAVAGQPPIEYPSDVEHLDANSAVKHYQPDIVLGCWVTAQTDVHKPILKQYGPDPTKVNERKLIREVKTYVHFGHEKIHGNKKTLKLPHQKLQFPWLISRTPNLINKKNVVYVWKSK